MKFLAAGAAMAVAMSVSSGAQATTTIDFDAFKHGGVVKVYNGAIIADGFSFTPEELNSGLGFWGGATPSNADPDGAALLNWNSRKVTVRRTDGDFFSFRSLDLADTYNSGAPAPLLFTFFDGKQTRTQTLTLDRAKGFETFTFQEDRIQWFSYAFTGSVGTQMDNLVVDVAANAGVPEPATWAMMILGFGAAGAALRRRDRSNWTQSSTC